MKHEHDKNHVKTFHRDLLDSISNKLMYSWVRLRPEIFYGRKPFIKDLSDRIKLAKKFYIGEFHSVPHIDPSKVDIEAVRLPFPLTLFEVVMKRQDNSQFVMIVVCREDEDKNIECSQFFLQLGKNIRSHHVYIPFVFTLRKEDGKFRIDAEEEEEFILAYTEHKTMLEREINSLKAKEFGLRQEMERMGKENPMIKRALYNISDRKEKIEQEIRLAEDTDPGEDFGMAIQAFYDRLVSMLLVLNCTNVKKVLHHPPEKLQKSRIKKGNSPEYPYYTLTIDRSTNENIFASPTSDGEPEGNVRLHWRRGHIKRRKSGNYWWNPHMVGKKELGMVEKNYKLVGVGLSKEEGEYPIKENENAVNVTSTD